MAQQKKDAKPAAKKNVKVMSKDECKKTVGGASFVTGGLAGPEDFNFTGGTRGTTAP